MELSLETKDILSIFGVISSMVAFAWHTRGMAGKVTIALNRLQSTVESIDQRLNREERKSSRAHERIDEISEKITRLEVMVDQIRGR